MDKAVEAELYNDIGAAVVDEIGTVETKILIYVEMQDESFGTVIRYLDSDSKNVRGAYSNPDISGALSKLRSHLLDQSSDKLWKSMEYWIDYGEVNISLSYDNIDQGTPIWERTAEIVENYFPGIPFKPD